jgi:hypothetical protein
MSDFDKLFNSLNGKFDDLNDDQKETVMELVAMFHYRDGSPHNDGSMGTIVISPRQLNNLLAYVLTSKGQRLEMILNGARKL